MTKRKSNFKALIAAVTVVSALTLSSVISNAEGGGNLVKFIFNGTEYSGGAYDFVDDDGYRHMGFEAELPTYEENYAIIYDVDAPQGESVRVITEETDPEFMSKVRAYSDAAFESEAEYEDFGIVLKDSELCEYHFGSPADGWSRSGSIGGEFMHTGIAFGKPSGTGDGNGTYYEWDFENEEYLDMKTVRKSIYYYVG